jgi:GntR family transcriptional regulator, transcriptional repressor for pyruvate dehydrogenase complex
VVSTGLQEVKVEMNTDPSVLRIRDRMQPMRMPAATELVVDHLQTMILDGTLRAGDKLPSEPELAQLLRVGRSTLREAKQTLVARGLIEPRGKLGTFVAPPPRDPAKIASLRDLLANQTLPDLHETRQIVETGALRAAAVRASDAEIKGLHVTLDQIAADITRKEPDVYLRLVTFHRNLVKASHNQVLVSVYDLLAHLIRDNQVPFYPSVSQLEEEVGSHRLLVEAVASRDPQTAASAIHEHLEESEDLRLEALHEAQATDP